MNSIKIGGVYRYYKGGLNKVIAIGTLSGTCDKYVVYESYEDHKIWIRPLNDFISKVDRNMYPYSQEYKFEKYRYEI